MTSRHAWSGSSAVSTPDGRRWWRGARRGRQAHRERHPTTTRIRRRTTNDEPDRRVATTSRSSDHNDGMIIEVDLTTVPPRTTLSDVDDITSLKVVTRGEHAFVARDTFVDLAGLRGSDPEWLARLDGMLSYAASKGWTDEHGAVRAHVEHQ